MRFFSMKILMVEDDPFTGESIAALLTAHRYTVDRVEDGQVGLELAGLWNYDMILLDVELPRLNGIEICKTLRSQGCTTPILILTVHNSSEAIIHGLDTGADDYVAKPCDPAQLLARIRALSRRGGNATSSTVLTWGDLCLDPVSAKVTYHQRNISLSSKEYKLLELFLRHPRHIFSRDAIIDRLWSLDNFPTDKAVTNLVKELRRKLRLDGMTEELLETLYGLGYRLCPEPERQALTQSASSNTSNTSNTSSRGQKVVDLTSRLDKQKQWLDGSNQLLDRFRASLEQRIAVLDQALEALQNHSLTDDRCQQAREEAHRLAGGLGTFDYEAGSALARAIEQLFAQETLTQANSIEANQAAKHQIERLSSLLVELKQSIAQPSRSLVTSRNPQSAVLSSKG